MSYMLVVEDSDEDFSTLQRILSKHCGADVALKRCLDGDEVLAICGIHFLPSLFKRVSSEPDLY